MTELFIDDMRKELDNKSTTSNELFNEARDKALKYQDEYNSFVTIMDKKEEVESNTKLSGIPYGLKIIYLRKEYLLLVLQI